MSFTAIILTVLALGTTVLYGSSKWMWLCNDITACAQSNQCGGYNVAHI